MDCGLIEISAIDEFSEIQRIPRESISEKIVQNIRSLNEKEELEPLIRNIIHDYNYTPHGPTEIADIISTNLHIHGKKKITGIVLKGKSFTKVSSKDVGHQFLKLSHIPEIGLMIFCAVGIIQDDAQRDFILCAKNAESDYLIIDATDCARLLITYEKICHHDGLPFDSCGRCSSGHEKPTEQILEIPTREMFKYSVLKEGDASYGAAKRYSAILLINPHYSHDIIRSIIREKTEEMKHREYYRNKHVEERWGETQAHVVWLYIASNLEDVQNFNWRCRSCWVDPDLPENLRPHPLNGQENLDEIEVSWNEEYYSFNHYLSQNKSAFKEVYLKKADTVCKTMLTLGDTATEKFQEYSDGSLTELDLIQHMQALALPEAKAFQQSYNIPMPPLECNEYHNVCLNLFAAVDNMFLLYSPLGLEKWSQKERDNLMQKAIDLVEENKIGIVYERKKIQS